VVSLSVLCASFAVLGCPGGIVFVSTLFYLNMKHAMHDLEKRVNFIFLSHFSKSMHISRMFLLSFHSHLLYICFVSMILFSLGFKIRKFSFPFRPFLP
jgi:hypothetical protein